MEYITTLKTVNLSLTKHIIPKEAEINDKQHRDEYSWQPIKETHSILRKPTFNRIQNQNNLTTQNRFNGMIMDDDAFYDQANEDTPIVVNKHQDNYNLETLLYIKHTLIILLMLTELKKYV